MRWWPSRRRQTTLGPTTEEPRSDTVLKSWEIGWKITNLCYDTERAVPMFFRTVCDGLILGAFDALAHAVCDQAHPYAPYPGCRCGFNAFDARESVMPYLARRQAKASDPGICLESPTLVRVGLKGRVISGTYTQTDTRWGYRAEIQQVTDIFLPRTCWQCSGATTHIRMWSHFANPMTLCGPERFIGASCGGHAGTEFMALGAFRESASRSGVNVHWNDE